MRQGRILLADDEASIRRFVGAMLRAEGFEVAEAVNGEEALRAVEEHSPDLVLLDIRMPKVDGFEVCRRVREWSDVPIIMLSAMPDSMDKAKCLNLGANDYLVKPFGIRELMERITAVRQRSSPGQQGQGMGSAYGSDAGVAGER